MNISHIFIFIFAINLAKYTHAKKRNPVLLISLDGFRADKLNEFLEKNPDSNFNRIVEKGVKAEYMKPSFPSITFPNHWTIVTGNYPCIITN